MRKFTKIYNKMNGIIMDDEKEADPAKDATQDMMDRIDKLNDFNLDL